MKHPALTRLFAVVLAVLCLTMLFAGLGSAGGALSGRRSGLADYDRLENRIEEYREIRASLEGKVGYAETSLTLREQQEQHDEESSRHRTELAVYTATRGGVLAGEEALKQAEAAFWEGKAQFESGLKLFEEQEAMFWEGYRQFQDGKRQLEEGRTTLELADSALTGLRAQVEQSRALAAVLESEDEDARKQLSIAAYDGLLQALDQATGLYTALKDQGGVSAEQMQQLAVLLSQQADVDLGQLLEGAAWEGISAESLQELEDRVTEATGMSVEEIRTRIQAQRDAIAGMDADAPITEEQFAALQAAYAQSRNWIEQIDAAIEEKLAEYENQLQDARNQMEAAREQIGAMDDYMEQGKAAMEQTRAALDLAAGQMAMGEQGIAQGRQELDKQAAELKEKAEQLRQEKTALDAEAEALAELGADADAQKELERREASVRLMLMEREGIQNRVDNGMELLPAAEDYAAALLRETERMATGRLWVSGLMLVGAVAGFIGIPAAFERNKSRFWLIAPVLVCFGCAVGAEVLCRILGRGDSYSALAVAAFAAIQLVLVIPKKKKS